MTESLAAILADRQKIEPLLREAGREGLTMDQIMARLAWNRLRVNDALCDFEFSVLGCRREKPKGRGRTATVYFLKEFNQGG